MLQRVREMFESPSARCRGPQKSWHYGTFQEAVTIATECLHRDDCEHSQPSGRLVVQCGQTGTLKDLLDGVQTLIRNDQWFIVNAHPPSEWRVHYNNASKKLEMEGTVTETIGVVELHVFARGVYPFQDKK